jgi:hypothetical protein
MTEMGALLRRTACPAGAVENRTGVVARPRERLNCPGLRAYLAIADRWGLDEKDRRRVLGAPSPATYGGWVRRGRAGEALVLPTGLLMRLATALTVHRLLLQLFGAGPEALDWLRAPHNAPPFAGQPPSPR